MLGRYEVIRHLASGGMADLLLARARGLEGFERHVVIKRIRADAENDQAFIDMFLVEARLAGALHHHNIVQVHDIGEENGKPYFAMEYVHGEDLRRLLALVVQKNEQIPFPVIVTIVTAVARALHHAHEQRGADQQTLGIVHRDVSPANIVVGYDGNVKVLDFGIARAAMRRTETQAGMLKGKAPYMAPEQCTGAPVDRRSDVFGLGIVLYELVTARRLFKAESDFTTMSMVVNGTFPKPSTVRKDLPPDLERIIMRALARDPGARYQTAEQMFTALEQLALTAEWRTSASSLASYMTQIFGTRTEPWLDKEESAPAVSVDFDGTRPGLASAPVDAAAAPAAAKVSNGVPGTSEAGASTGVRIPEASAGVKSGKVPLKPVPANPTAARSRPKTVQVPVPKSAAVTEMVPTTNAAVATQVNPVVSTDAAAKQDNKSDIAPLEAKPAAKVEAKPAAKVEAKPAAKVEAKPEVKVEAKPLRPLSKLPPKTDPKVPVRAATEELTNPVIEPEETHTEVNPLPPAISPHAPRQLKPLPPPSGAKPSGKESGPLRPAAPIVAAAAAPLDTPVARAATDLEENTDLEEATELSPAPEPPFASRRTDPTAIVEPLPSPLINDAPRARRKSTASPLAARAVVEDTDQLNAAPPRPRWVIPAIGGGLLVLVIIVIAIARSGGDPAIEEPPETAAVTKPAEPLPAPTAAPADDVRTEARPRTWANSQEPEPAGSAAAVDPAPSVATPEPVPTPDPVEPTPEPTPEPVEPTPEPTPEPEPVAIDEPAEPTPVVATKPAPKPVVKPTPKPVAKPAPKPVAVAKTKPAPKTTAIPKPKPKPTGKALPKPKWNPNTLFPNKK